MGLYLRKNFSRKELECHCGCGLCNISDELLDILQSMRDEIKIPIDISSGFRCKEYNFRVGGVENSQHILGTAVDILTNKYTATEYAKLLKAVFTRDKIKGLGFGKGFLHIDIRESKEIVAWRY
jgi:uncharacterized protein YcbK (DUF882 family)